MEFLRSFLRRHFAGKPEVSSRNVGCFLQLDFMTTLNEKPLLISLSSHFLTPFHKYNVLFRLQNEKLHILFFRDRSGQLLILSETVSSLLLSCKIYTFARNHSVCTFNNQHVFPIFRHCLFVVSMRNLLACSYYTFVPRATHS